LVKFSILSSSNTTPSGNFFINFGIAFFVSSLQKLILKVASFFTFALINPSFSRIDFKSRLFPFRSAIKTVSAIFKASPVSLSLFISNIQAQAPTPNALAIQSSFPISSQGNLKDSSIFLDRIHSHLLENQSEQKKEIKIILLQEISVSFIPKFSYQ